MRVHTPPTLTPHHDALDRPSRPVLLHLRGLQISVGKSGELSTNSAALKPLHLASSSSEHPVNPACDSPRSAKPPVLFYSGGGCSLLSSISWSSLADAISHKPIA